MKYMLIILLQIDLWRKVSILFSMMFNYSGVYKRVNDKIQIVNDIYYILKYDADILEYHKKIAMRELALEKVRKDLYSDYPSRLSC